jgi:hypothetical protein
MSARHSEVDHITAFYLSIPIPQEYYLLGYNAAQSVESQPAFRRLLCLLPDSAGFLSDLLLNPEDGGNMFFRNVGRLSTGYMA